MLSSEVGRALEGSEVKSLTKVSPDIKRKYPQREKGESKEEDIFEEMCSAFDLDLNKKKNGTRLFYTDDQSGAATRSEC